MVFDLDGTLVDTVETRIRAWMDTFAERGIPARREQVAGLIGADGKKLAREVAEKADMGLDDAAAEQVDHRSGEIFNELNLHPRPIAGARSLLLALFESSLPWAIATSSRPEQVQTSVAALELPGEPRIVDGSHVERAKPAPDLLLLAAEQLDVQVPDTWYVGDATWDMLAASAAGMIGIGVPYGSASAKDLLNAGARVVTGFAELLNDLRSRGLLPAT